MTGTINIISKCINIHSVSNIERDNNDNETYTKQKNSVIAELQKINKNQELEEEYESDFIEETQDTQESQESQESQDEQESQESQETQDEQQVQETQETQDEQEVQDEKTEKKYRCSYILINSLIISMIVVESIQIGVKIFSLFQ